MKKTITLFSLLIALLIGLQSSGAAEKPITIAAVFAKTGVASHMDFQHFRGVAVAVEEINAHGGLLGRPVEVIELDSQSAPLKAKYAAQEAVNRGVTAVIGSSWSSHSLAMAPVLQEAGIPMISPSSTNPEVTLKGDYIFRVCFVDSFQGQVMAHFAYGDLNTRTAMVLKNVSSVYSIDLGEFFARTFERLGSRVLGEARYKEKDLDFSAVLSEVKSHNPDIVFLPGYTRDSGLIMKQAASHGIRALFLGGDGWSNEMYEFGGMAIEGTFYCTHWHPEVSFPESNKLKSLYELKYQTPLQESYAPWPTTLCWSLPTP